MTKAVELAQVASTGVSEAFKNRIINGAMVVNQRNSTVTVNSGAGRVFSVDRWAGETNSSGAFTIAQSTTAPAGFTNSTVATVTSTFATSGNTFAFLEQQIEGYNAASFQFGTADAQQVTISFWARSSVSGTYSGVFRGGSYSYVFNYTLSANTWTYVTQTVPALTVGSGYNTTNGSGASIRFSLYVNGTTAGAPGSWISADYTGSTTQVNWLANAGATFFITGVQIEVGSSATSFEYRPYGTELQLCQRYAIVYGGGDQFTEIGGTGFAINTTQVDVPVAFPVQMRAIPSVTNNNGNVQVSDGASGTAISGLAGASNQTSNLIFALRATTGGGLTTYRPYRIESNNSNFRATFSAEL